MFHLIAIAVLFTAFGVLLTLAVEYHFLNAWLMKQPLKSPTTPLENGFLRYQLPKELKDFVDKADSEKHNETCLALNLFFQFLYKELKDTKKVRRWFMKKLSVEFEELLQKTATGKLIDQLTLRDLALGNQFPAIKTCGITNVQLHESQQYIEELDITMDLDYTGGFQLSVDADLVLGRSVYLAVQITKLSGKVRLQLTRTPFTHWSIVFVQEPVMEFKVESHFQGRHVPQVTSLIISQIRRAIKKKHTLPNYKVRFKPFFDKPDTQQREMDDNSFKLLEGHLEVMVIECSRISKNALDSKVFCTLGMDSLAWVELLLHQSASWMTYDVEINKLAPQGIGIMFKQEFIPDKSKQCVVVESITPDSPASNVDLRKGDVLIAINNVKISSFNQTAKLLRQTSNKTVIRVERRCHLKASRSHEVLPKVDEQILSLKDVDPNLEGDDEEDLTNSRVKPEESSDGSLSNPRTPTHGSPVKKIFLSAQMALDRRRKSEGCELALKAQLQEKNLVATQADAAEEQISKNVDLKKTSLVPGNQDPVWEENFDFEIEEHHRYLNVGVWCKKFEKLDIGRTLKNDKDKSPKIERDVLLGQVSVSLLDVTMECATNSQGFHQQTFQLKPPTLRPTVSRSQKLSSHPGFDETLCYGDITLAFIHKPSSLPKLPKKSPTPTPTPTRMPVPAVSASTVVAAASSTNDSDDDTDSTSGDTIREQECLQIQAHDFVGTQFRTATVCHFCGKKIWLKVAFQCKKCKMISHKKCVTKCLSDTTCTSDGAKLIPQALRPLSPRLALKRPEIVTTDAVEDHPAENADSAKSLERLSPTPPSSPKTHRRSIPSLLANIASTAAQAKSGLTRAGSAHNLAPPFQSFHSQSKSLPPSPQHSPLSSRKASLQGNPFQTNDDSEPEEDVELTVQRLLQHPNDEVLVSAAKEMGKELYLGLETKERRTKLNAMIRKVQAEIESEAATRIELAKEDKDATDVTHKTRLAFQIAKSDERSRALAVLLLHYYAGIQHCQEMEESSEALDSFPGNQEAQSVLHSTENSYTSVGEGNLAVNCNVSLSEPTVKYVVSKSKVT